jgi:hypothetical protein
MEEKASSFKKRANLTEKHNDELCVEIENTRRKRLQIVEHRQLKIAEIAEVRPFVPMVPCGRGVLPTKYVFALR